VSWAQAQAFSRWAGGRLPTEAEWEYAAQYGTGAATGRSYVMSVEDYARPAAEGSRRYTEIEPVAWFQGNSGGVAHEVGQKKASEIGLYDMLGNVIEWVSDWYGDYPSAPAVDPVGATTGFVRVIRGGGWASPGLRVRVTGREHTDPDDQGVYLGFRPVRAIPAR